jgi:curved DNA-binding protein CbpA
MSAAFVITSVVRKPVKMKTAYELLGVPRTATPSEIEHRYRYALNAHMVQCGSRRLSKKERARVCAMRDAYLLLASPARRHAYDQQLAQRARVRSLIIDTGGMVLATLSLLAGIALIAGAARLNQPDAAPSAQPSRLTNAERTAAGPQDRPASAGNQQAH